MGANPSIQYLGLTYKANPLCMLGKYFKLVKAFIPKRKYSPNVHRIILQVVIIDYVHLASLRTDHQLVSRPGVGKIIKISQ